MNPSNITKAERRIIGSIPDWLLIQKSNLEWSRGRCIGYIDGWIAAEFNDQFLCMNPELWRNENTDWAQGYRQGFMDHIRPDDTQEARHE